MSNMPVFENPCGAYSRYEITKHIPLDRLEEICQAERDGRCRCTKCDKVDVHAVGREIPFCWFCGARMDGDSG